MTGRALGRGRMRPINCQQVEQERRQGGEMTVRLIVVAALSGVLSLAFNPLIHATQDHDRHAAPVGLLKAVREATRDFLDVRVATGVGGYASTGSCVTGPERGAMGVHYAN